MTKDQRADGTRDFHLDRQRGRDRLAEFLEILGPTPGEYLRGRASALQAERRRDAGGELESSGPPDKRGGSVC